MADSAPADPAPGRRRRSRRFLTQDLILEAAIGLVEREGADALTLRRLGAELGVDHTAVLRHYSDKDDLLLALSNHLLATSLEGFSPSANWRGTLADLARRVRRACLAHPQVATLAARRTSRREAEFRGADIVIGALLEAGLQGRQAASCYRSLVEVALSYSALEASVLALDPDAFEAEQQAWSREYLALPAERYPNIAAVAQHLADANAEDQFEVTLELLLDAIELRARRANKTAETPP